MQRTPIQPDLNRIPAQFHSLLERTDVYDSSCSPAARVYFIQADGGLFLKSAAPGSLKLEKEMDAYFHSLGLGPEVLAYHSADKDWLLTRRVPGEDCLYRNYLDNPARLAHTMAEMLLDLHSRDHSACPVRDHTGRYLQTARDNYAARRFDIALFPDNWGYRTPEDAWQVVRENAKYLKTDTLLHGDYCLPNILLDNWRPAGFIDVGRGGVGDRHIDLFWGVWSLNYNLKTDRYCSRFLDAYGRNRFEEEMLRVIAAFEVFE